MTPSDLSKIAAKLPLSESVRKLNSIGESGQPIVAPEPQAPRISTDEDKLNKLERDWLAVLRSRGLNPGIQNITLKLAYDCRYSADFSVWSQSGQLTLYETKGFMREDAKVKLQVAARLFPQITFVLVTRRNGQWLEMIVRP